VVTVTSVNQDLEVTPVPHQCHTSDWGCHRDHVMYVSWYAMGEAPVPWRSLHMCIVLQVQYWALGGYQKCCCKFKNDPHCCCRCLQEHYAMGQALAR
jgi:hypothetical protein